MALTTETHPFPPFVPKNSKHLILGSFVGKMTEDNRYDWFYGTKRNQFWPIIRAVYKLPLRGKEEKENLFSELKIAITDIIYSCRRIKGTNLDNNLTDIVYNIKTVESILAKNKIDKIFFSSRFVEKEYKKTFKNLIKRFPNVLLITLPSPSPRFARITLNEKVEKYKELLPSLGL